MPRRSTRNKGGAAAPKVKKAKVDGPQVDGTHVRFEWEADDDKWVQYSRTLNKKIAQAFSAKNKQVEVEVAPGVKMEVVFDQGVQRNRKTGFQRRVRVAMAQNGQDEYRVLEWQSDDGDWNPYALVSSLQVATALDQGKKALTLSSHQLDLRKMTQTNTSTKTVRQIRLQQQDSEPPEQDDDDDDDNKDDDEVDKEEEEEEDVEIPISLGSKRKSGKKSGKPNSSSTDNKSTVKTVVVKKGCAPVDPSCPIASKCHVYGTGRDSWDCMLNQTNIGNNNNKFYLIQVLQAEGRPEYHCWQRWGRVGYNGQTNLVSCGPNLQAALNAFDKKFRDKTGNVWGNRDFFAQQPGKYDLLKMDYNTQDKSQEEEDEAVEKDETTDKDSVPESSLDPRVQDLVRLVCDIQSMEDQIVEMKFDTKKAPLGKLTKDQVKAGYSALKDIEKFIKKQDFGPGLRDACSNFYTRIPHVFGMKAPPLIRTPQDVKKKLQLLEALEDIEIAIKLLKGGDKSENPVDRHYHQLQCGLQPLDKSTDTFKLMERYLQDTHASTHTMYRMELEQLFEMDRSGEAARFKDYGNRQLLWHGSRLTNWAGILGQGLRIAPPEAPVTGYMFGKGVYFADMSSKSANYCFATKTRPCGLLALCDVSLGQVEEKLQADPDAADLPAGKHSVQGQGQMVPDESTHVTLPDGLVVPVGKQIKKAARTTGHALNYNEFIVYDTCQVKLKYLLQVKFNFR